MNEQETAVDIIAEMHDLAAHRDWHNHTGQSNRERMSDLADRLDRARMKMEIEIANLRKENAKLREAIVTIQNCDINKEEDCITLYRTCDAALATEKEEGNDGK